MKKKILVIDDSESNTLLIQSLFEEKGKYHVDVIRKSQKTFDFLRDNKPDLVLLDLMMPQVDGFEILANIRENEKLRSIPVIIVSAWDMPDNIQRAMALGANEYVKKPISLDDLYQRVESYLE
jgi:CheY-like chemotaxis protein